VLIASLVGKNLVAIDAKLNQSICFDTNGICYEWGTLSKTDGIVGRRRIDGIKKLQLGNGYRLGLTSSGEVYFWGSIKDGSREIFASEEPIKVSRS
jgi:alpha-tubulin suppressor-like RCC1 family protein